VNLSSDREQEFFSDGLTEELLNLLAKVPSLRVAARTSSFAFKGKSEDLRSVGQKLNVAHVLEGSVRRSGDQIRITTQLIKASDGYHLWSETYDRKLTDVFAVQDEIATAVVGALKLQLLQAPSSRARSTARPEAYNQYLLGRQFLERSSLEDRKRAAAAFRQAVDLDPGYAPAWAGLARATFWVADMAESAAAIASGQARALEAADRAVAAGPELPDGYLARGFLRSMVKWDWAGAAEDMRHALSLAPESPEAISLQAQAVLTPEGRLEDAAGALRRATVLDPLNPGLWTTLGGTLLALGRIGPGREALSRSLEIDPGQSFPRAHLAEAYLLEARPAEALAATERVPDDVFRLELAAMAEHDLGHAEASQRMLEELTRRFAYMAAYQVAETHAWRGEPDRAFEWLERAYSQRDTGLLGTGVDPFLRKLRGDARWKPFLRKMNLPPG
jgi:TolB-like protein/tetratricopeptide (TPR) repeat protein